MQSIIDFFHEFVSRPDKVLLDLISHYGYWIYGFLFLVIFAETGLIIMSFIMPFLPGDALIFAIGMISAHDAQNHLHIEFIIPLLMLAALLGDNLNYYIGKRFGVWMISNPGKFYIKPKYLNKATEFLRNHGKKAIVIARFMPVVRTMMPFVCGATSLDYKTFLKYSIIGAVLWVGVIAMLGYFLGSIPFVQKNFEFFIFGIILAANMPLILQLIKAKLQKKNKA